jgi:hypothetical protein
MARRPIPGRAKTRLAEHLGDQTAAGLYAALLHDTLARSATIPDVALYVAVTPDDGPPAPPVERSTDTGWSSLVQRGDDLGERLANVFEELFADGHEAVVIVGSDSPSLPTEFVKKAFDHLREDDADAVIGPAFDGGYYLIGVSRGAWLLDGPAVAALLRDSPIGTPQVAGYTLDALERAGLRTAVLPAWIDVDTKIDAAQAQGLRPGAPRRGAESDRLRDVYLHLTHHCNTGCPQCYLRDVRGARIAGGGEEGGNGDRPHELSTAAWRDVIDQAARLGATSFVFIGGDPFLRSDLVDLIDHVTGRHKASARLFFNSPVDAETAARLARVGRGRLVPLISVDGPAEINDALRGSGNFLSALDSIRTLLAAGLRPVANTVLLRPVLEGLPSLIDTLADEGLTTLHFILPHSRGGLASDGAMIPSGEEMLEAFDTAEIAARRRGVVIDNVSAWRSRLRRRRDLCSAGCTLLAIDPGGLVHACPITCGDPAFVAGDLTVEPLERIWRRSPTLDLLRATHARDREQCGECAVVDACGGECWVQAHYAAVAADTRAGYLAPFPYCGLVRPLLERLVASVAEGATASETAPEDLTPFDCI